jgi:hypothetical protein
MNSSRDNFTNVLVLTAFHFYFIFRFADNCFSGNYITTIGVDFKIRNVFQYSKRKKDFLEEKTGKENVSRDGFGF